MHCWFDWEPDRRPLLLISGAPDWYFRSERFYRAHHFVTPRNRNRVARVSQTGKPFAMDNDAFRGFHPIRFHRMLEAYKPLSEQCLFCSVPDVVADHSGTLALWPQWAPIVAGYGFPPAFVLQDGASPSTIPWKEAGAVFVGGSTEWKEGPAAASLVRLARERGIWAHWGRVNTRRRVLHVVEIGADSIDGTGCSRYPDALIPRVHGWLTSATRRQVLFRYPSEEDPTH